MLEVDVDGDQTLDFYEYLKVADMLSQKNGKIVITFKDTQFKKTFLSI